MPKSPGIKRANTEYSYTAEQLLELKRCAQDPIYCINTYFKIKHPTKGAVTFKLYPYQKDMIRSFVENRNTIVLSARQTGKSETSAAYLLWYAMFNFDKTVLIASNKNDNAMLMIDRIRFMYERLPDWLKPGADAGSWNKHELSFDNGTKIHSTATAENSGRGMPISLLFLDEFAFVRDSIQDLFWTSISPTLATGGNCIVTSTPNGDTNLFAQMWRGAKTKSNGFYWIEVKWNEPPGRDEKFKEEEIGKIGLTKWRQEYECQFISDDPLLIDSIVLNNLTVAAKDRQPVAVINETVFWKKPVSNGTYVIGVDPATGSGKDFTTFVIIESPSMVQIGEWRSNTMSSPTAYSYLKKLLLVFERLQATVYFSVENNGVGEGIITAYQLDESPPTTAEFISEQGKDRLGMTTTGKSKMRACLTFKEMVERNTLQVMSPLIVEEMKQYIRHEGSYAAKTGATDDLVAATLIALRLLDEIAVYDQEAYEKMYTEMYYGGTDDQFYDDGYEPDPFIC